jgi:hypothetical protein
VTPIVARSLGGRDRVRKAHHIRLATALDAVGALGVLAVRAKVADDEHGAALAAARLVGRHGVCEVGCAFLEMKLDLVLRWVLARC